MPSIAQGCLTSAECEVHDLAVSGRSNAEIAAFRGVSINTIANQLASVFRKIGVASRQELVARAATLQPHLPLRGPERRHEPHPHEPRLSKREAEVARFVCLGWSNKVIAYELGISPSTVGVQLRSALRKLRLASRAQLIGSLGTGLHGPR